MIVRFIQPVESAIIPGDISIQASPAFCCPALVIEAMANEIERITNVPVVSITDDGAVGNKNEFIIPYLKYPRRERRIDKGKSDSRQQRLGS